MAALRRSSRPAQILLRIEVELLFALGTAEVIRLPLVLSLSCGGGRLYVHAAHRIFYSCCAIHYDLSVAREFCSNVDWQAFCNSSCTARRLRGLANGSD